MRRFRKAGICFLLAMAVASGAFLAALRSGDLRVADLRGAKCSPIVATPVCNPAPVGGVDPDGELPGGG